MYTPFMVAPNILFFSDSFSRSLFPLSSSQMIVGITAPCMH